MRKKFKLFLPRAIYVVSVVVVLIGYSLTNRPQVTTFSTQTLVDTIIPLVPVFVIPYLLYLPFLFGSLVWMLTRFSHLERLWLRRFVFAQIIAIVFFIFFPTTMVRPIIVNGGLFEDLVRFVYTNDQPFNLFPSTHVLHTLIMTSYWVRRGYSRQLIFPFTAIVCVSTVLVKQHYALDIVGGIMVYVVTDLIIKRITL